MWRKSEEVRKKFNGFEIKCLRGMFGVTLMDMISNIDVRVGTGMVRKLADWIHLQSLEATEEGDESRGEYA